MLLEASVNMQHVLDQMSTNKELIFTCSGQ